MGLEETRKECEMWDDEDGCVDDYPGTCPVFAECKKDAEGD